MLENLAMAKARRSVNRAHIVSHKLCVATASCRHSALCAIIGRAGYWVYILSLNVVHREHFGNVQPKHFRNPQGVRDKPSESTNVQTFISVYYVLMHYALVRMCLASNGRRWSAITEGWQLTTTTTSTRNKRSTSNKNVLYMRRWQMRFGDDNSTVLRATNIFGLRRQPLFSWQTVAVSEGGVIKSLEKINNIEFHNMQLNNYWGAPYGMRSSSGCLRNTLSVIII